MKKMVIKRNGTKVPYEKEKVYSALTKAFIEVDGQIYEDETINEIVDTVTKFIKTERTVEEIQDLIEDELMASERKDVARAYIRYRYKQEVARERKKDILNAVRIKLRGEKNEKQNANMDEDSFGGRTGEATSVITKPLALEDLISETARNNHNWNRIYIHDLDNYYVGCHNCLSIPFDDLLANGFNTRQTDVRPAGCINTAFQLVAVIFQIQSLQQFGGVSATHLDWTMVPYVRKSFVKHYIEGLKYRYNNFHGIDIYRTIKKKIMIFLLQTIFLQEMNWHMNML